jgi:hypothetical protein
MPISMVIRMDLKRVLQIYCLFLLLPSSACNWANPQIVEVTRIVQTTVEITRLVTQVVTPTPVPRVLSSATSAPISPTSQETPFPLNQIDNQRIILITQYYTFLGHGLYSDAYQLLSASNQRSETEHQYIDRAKLAFKKVEITNIQPFLEWRNQQAPGYLPRPGDKDKFTVDIVTWGEGNMSGSVSSGQSQEFWITIIQENGRWKID